jgi:hypothetical protein
VEVSGRQVRRYVRERRRALGLPVDEVCVPLCREPGGEAEVDWGEAKVLLAGVLAKVYLFLMRACFSGACFVRAFPRETQQAFLEAHVAALEWYGGCFGLVRYDNLGSAVKTVLKGRRRVETERFIALRSHYLFEASFTGPGEQGADGKGGVEGGVGWWRRRYLVPVPGFASLAELNDYLAVCMIKDLSRTIRGRRVTIGQALSEEIELLRPLPAEPFDSFEHARPLVDAKALVTVRQNQYSVPVSLAGLKVAAKIGAREIVLCHDGREVARHPRLLGRYGICARLDHYLELLARKPGALRSSLPLRQEREQGRWPECFDRLWRAIEAKVGPTEAARRMVDVLMLCRGRRLQVVERAVAGALAAGAHDGRAVQVLVERQARPRPEPLDALPERLARHDRPEPSLFDYNELIGREARR